MSGNSNREKEKYEAPYKTVELMSNALCTVKSALLRNFFTFSSVYTAATVSTIVLIFQCKASHCSRKVLERSKNNITRRAVNSRICRLSASACLDT